jgi:hypothetical protein
MPKAPWSASAVEARPVASLLPYAANARTHSPEQVAQIAASIIEFGFVAPILVDERGRAVSPAVGCRTSLSAQEAPPDRRRDR